MNFHKVIFCLLASMLFSSICFAQVNVVTAQYGSDRVGANLSETLLNTSNVNVVQFGKLFTLAVDGQIYAQPLYLSRLAMPGQGVHNVVLVATMNNSVYAFDADQPSANPLWHASLGTPVPTSGVIQGTIGILSTPAINLGTKTIYVVSETNAGQKPVFFIHALDLLTGKEKNHGPASISATVPGSGEGSRLGRIALTASSPSHVQRPAILLANGRVYVAFGGFYGGEAFRGWLLGFQESDLSLPPLVFNTTPNGMNGSIWQSGGGPSSDTSGHIYVVTGDGSYDGVSSFGESILKLTPNPIKVIDSFTPDYFAVLNSADADLGNSSAMVVPDTELVIAASKEGRVYSANRLRLGGLQQGNPQAQIFTAAVQGINHLAFWNRTINPLLYVWGWNDVLKSYLLVNGKFSTAPSSQGARTANFPGGVLAVSANGTAVNSGILWAASSTQNALGNSVPGILSAYDASDVSREIWNSTQNPGRDGLGNLAKFVAPTVANGKVYTATFSGQLAVYGLLCSSTVTGNIGVVYGGFRHSSSNGHLQQTLTLTNESSSAIQGPVFVALDNLSGSARLINLSGNTSCAIPANIPYATVSMREPFLMPGASVTVDLDFLDGSKAAITYGARILAGGISR